ncbi:MAG: hypothetical protein R2804_17520 [Cyclobacteriaceae bacterium]
MSKPTGTNIGTNLIIAAFGTAMLAPIHCDLDSAIIPMKTIPYQKLTSNSWEEDIVISSNLIDPKINSLKSFSENLLKNTADIDPEIMEVVNENYWGLL